MLSRKQNPHKQTTRSGRRSNSIVVLDKHSPIALNLAHLRPFRNNALLYQSFLLWSHNNP